jgi:hypothetical protein
MVIKTVQNLIDELNKIEDKTKPVFGFIIDELEETNTHELVKITLVDNSISDRVDINLTITN